MGTDRIKSIAVNRKALHDYEVLERVEAGLVLVGTEIKSIRAGRANLQEAYAQMEHGELWLHHCHVAPWTGGGPWNHDPLRPKKLLLHDDEIRRLGGSAAQKGLTLVPLRLYIRGHHAKVELALARGKRQYDKRRVIMQRETEREMERALRSRR